MLRCSGLAKVQRTFSHLATPHQAVIRQTYGFSHRAGKMVRQLAEHFVWLLFSLKQLENRLDFSLFYPWEQRRT